MADLIRRPNPTKLPDSSDVVGAQRLTGDFLDRHYAAASRAWQVPKPHGVWEATVGAILEQRVTGKEAKATWRTLATDYGYPAPGLVPAGPAVLPEPDRFRRIPSWGWPRLGVNQARSGTLMRDCSVAHMLARLPDLDTTARPDPLTRSVSLGGWRLSKPK